MQVHFSIFPKIFLSEFFQKIKHQNRHNKTKSIIQGRRKDFFPSCAAIGSPSFSKYQHKEYKCRHAANIAYNRQCVFSPSCSLFCSIMHSCANILIMYHFYFLPSIYACFGSLCFSILTAALVFSLYSFAVCFASFNVYSLHSYSQP